jgi:hypothetical protein
MLSNAAAPFDELACIALTVTDLSIAAAVAACVARCRTLMLPLTRTSTR